MRNALTPSELYELANRNMTDVRPHPGGVALPDMPWLQPGAIIDSATAQRFGAQLIIAADEHDEIQDRALEPVSAARVRGVRDERRLRELLAWALEKLPEIRGGGADARLWEESCRATRDTPGAAPGSRTDFPGA